MAVMTIIVRLNGMFQILVKKFILLKWRGGCTNWRMRGGGRGSWLTDAWRI